MKGFRVEGLGFRAPPKGSRLSGVFGLRGCLKNMLLDVVLCMFGFRIQFWVVDEEDHHAKGTRGMKRNGRSCKLTLHCRQ